MIADRIKSLREQQNITQSDLAKQLGITRSSVNAWEMGISVPSTQYIVELAHIFNVSTDYLLGKSDVRNPEELKEVPFANAGGLDTNGLDEEDLKELQKQVDYIKKLKGMK